MLAVSWLCPAGQLIMTVLVPVLYDVVQALYHACIICLFMPQGVKLDYILVDTHSPIINNVGSPNLCTDDVPGMLACMLLSNRHSCCLIHIQVSECIMALCQQQHFSR